MFAAFLPQFLVLTAGLSGTVFDPQDLPVPEARVELACGAQHGAVETDRRGRFTIEMVPTSGGCRLLVTRQGFAPYEQRVGTATEALRITLRIADLSQQVDVTAEPTSSRSIGSVVLSGGDLGTFAGTTADLIRYARLLAGGTMLASVIYVDGLPASVLPPLAMVAAIAVNADPFTPERADGDVTSIEITTKAPARKLTFHVGGDVLGIGGGDALAPDSRSASAFRNLGVAGPLPSLPLTFVANMSLGRVSRDAPIQAVVPDADVRLQTATSLDRSWSGTLSLHYAPRAPLTARFSYRQSLAQSVNLGVGGIVLPEAGSSSSFVTREARATVTGISARLLYEGNLLISQRQWNTRANTVGAGIMVPGDVVMGGAPIAAGRTGRTGWTTKHVLRGRSRTPWMAGVAMSGISDTDEQTPNPAGLFEFADAAAYRRGLSGANSATWFVTRGNGSVHSAIVRIAPFVQKSVLSTDRFEIAAGARADYQPGYGALVSPRLSMAARWRGLNVRAGAGLFAKDLPTSVFVSALRNDGQHLQQLMVLGASFAGASDPDLRLQTSIRSSLAPDVTSPRELMGRLSVERPIGRLVPGIEYTWTRGRHLLGSERLADGTGWLDRFASNRAAERHRLHGQLQYSWKGRHLSAQYEWIRARDNTDGPFSFAEQPGRLDAEWARSTGVSPHNLTAMGTFMLPASISLNVIHSWRSPAPYNITTGLDTRRSGLLVDRGGRARNSGDAPGYRSLDVYVHRRIQLPDFFKRAGSRIHASLGAQAQNILSDRNYLSLGSVIGAANFGRPIAAYPGRSLRLSLSVN